MSSDQQEFDFLNREECVLTLNYAWYHTIGCAVLLLYLYGVGQTSHFEAGHNFGLFAMLCDYGVMYMVKGTRTLSVVSTGVDTDDLYGIGTFLFFGWFDYLGGFALLIFARNVSDVIASRSITKTNVIVILQHVLQWSLVPYFTVPNPFHNNDGVILPPMLGIDDRTIVVSRASPKSTYGVMFLVFSILLWKTTRFTKREYCAVLVSGLACGSLHHLFLYFFGMRGYDSMLALLTTLATEWPALLCGEAYLRTAFGNNNQQKLSFDYSKQGRRFLYMVLVAILLFKLPNDEQLTEFLISVIPGQHMQSFGTTMLWMKTCVDVPMLFGRKEPLQCTREDDDSIWVISTPAKSGAVLRYVGVKEYKNKTRAPLCQPNNGYMKQNAEVCRFHSLNSISHYSCLKFILWKLPFALTIPYIQRQDIAGHCHRMQLLFGHGNPRERWDSRPWNQDTHLPRKALARAHGYGRMATIRSGTFREQHLPMCLHDARSIEQIAFLLYLQQKRW